MGRSTRAQADQNRSRIVEAARGLFRAGGIDAVGISDVMRAAGMTQGGFYRHFENKDALAAEVCNTSFEQAEGRWRNVAASAVAAGQDAIEAVATYYLTKKPPEATCPMVALAPRRGAPQNLVVAYAEGVQRMLDTLIDIAGQGNEQRARTTFAAIVGINMLRHAAPDVQVLSGAPAF